VTDKGQSASDHRQMIPAFSALCGRVACRNRGLTLGAELFHLPSPGPKPCISLTGLRCQAPSGRRQFEHPQTFTKSRNWSAASILVLR
jgi:hypothetical protein